MSWRNGYRVGLRNQRLRVRAPPTSLFTIRLFRRAKSLSACGVEGQIRLLRMGWGKKGSVICVANAYIIYSVAKKKFAKFHMLSRISSSLARVCARRSLTVLAPSVRAFSGAAASKLHSIIKSEFQMEKEQYEQIETIKSFLKENSNWKLTESEGDVNMKLEKETGDRKVVIEWQLVSPFGADVDMMEEGNQESEEMPMDSTDFTVTIQDKTGERGITFFCQTASGEGHRYMIGNVRSFMSASERDSSSAYNGPDFEDLDEGISEELGNWLTSIGLTDEVCDFIDASAIDKEQREYMRWLKNVESFIQA